MATFTATNGTSPKAPNAETNNVPNYAGPSESTNGGSPPQAPPTGDPSSVDQPPKDASPIDAQAAEGLNSERPSFQAVNHVENDSSHKRKRSDEDMEDAPRDGHAQPERNSGVAGPDRPYLTTERDPYERERETQAYGDEHRERDRESWYSPRESRDDKHPYSQPASAVPDSAQTDEQMGEVLRRATEQDYPQTSPEGEEGSVGYGQYGTPERRAGGPGTDPKKRKRNFSNRTKTGCLTCRRRKKKCDELKPECK